MIHSVDDVQVLNDAYANGYSDCEKDHREEWETDAWRGGFVIGCYTALLLVVFITLFGRFLGGV